MPLQPTERRALGIKSSSSIRLSDLPCYAKAAVAAADREFAVARSSYLECIAICRDANDLGNVGFLLQQLGDVEAEAGNRKAAERYHHEAIALDPKSPLPRIFYARALLRHANDTEAAQAELDRAEALLGAANFPCDDEELPFSYYEREIASLRAELHAAGRSNEP